MFFFHQFTKVAILYEYAEGVSAKISFLLEVGAKENPGGDGVGVVIISYKSWRITFLKRLPFIEFSLKCPRVMHTILLLLRLRLLTTPTNPECIVHSCHSVSCCILL